MADSTEKSPIFVRRSAVKCAPDSSALGYNNFHAFVLWLILKGSLA